MNRFTFLCWLIAVAGCGRAAAGSGSTAAGAISPRELTDSLYAVISADRAVYTREVVQRLHHDEKVIGASEHFHDDKTLPLPAQMFRMGAETVSKGNPPFSYALLSSWPINKQNAPRTKIEETGLAEIARTRVPFYGEETLGGKRYFAAVYPDVALSGACVGCHNDHADSPRRDFKEGDVMGGVVIRVVLKE